MTPAAPKRGRGRPPLPAGEARTERLSVPVTPDERQRYTQLAAAEGLDLAELVRSMLERRARRVL